MSGAQGMPPGERDGHQESIEVVRPPGDVAPRLAAVAASGAKRGAARAVALGSLIALLGVAAAVIFVLPDWVAEHGVAPAVREPGPSLAGAPAPVASASEPVAMPAPGTAGAARSAAKGQPAPGVAPAPQSTPPAGESGNAAGKRAAERELGETLRRQAVLESEKVEVWAPAEYAELSARLASADGLFSASRFERAAQVYREVREQLDRLDASRDVRLAAALRAGQAALEQTAGEEAMRQFGIALALQGDNAAARLGMRRARTIDQVAALLQSGLAHFRTGNLETARDELSRALRLDERFEPARGALSKVEKMIAERAFRRAMSAALEAIGQRDFPRARRALSAARKIRPDAPEVKQSAARLAGAEQLARLATIRAEARTLAAGEHWSEAADKYAAALKIDPHVAFAIDGRRHSLEMAELDHQVQRYLDQPRRLASAVPLANAKAILHAAGKRTDLGPRLLASLDTLAHLVRIAQTPVQVVIASDGQTEVSVYKVGRFGRFARKVLQLRPGTYTAVGVRAGYRDVRLVFRVGPDGTGNALRVVCEERI